MKAALLFVAAGALAVVNAEENRKKPTPEDISAIFDGDAKNIDWSNFSPEALGMHLNYDEMSTEELEKVVDAFVRLGLISPEERESFGASLVDPVMRSMLQTVTENWPATMQKIMKDPEYIKFLKGFQNNMDEAALATIVGMKEGLQGALRDREEKAN
ncbi:hypothetical protein, conserved [Eimeria brunetti]|uniref:Eimeria-specific protein n=1 Tax=Eimeria brunetti TaxID=51314 RepID=U6LRT3_9EIME|nr:hypothetical protein, conserved [Eimeria brunetti]